MTFLLHERFLESVKAFPDLTAVSEKKETVTYQKLHSRAGGVARRLIHVEIRRNDRIAVFAKKGISLYASILGVLMAGGAYVPLEPTYPAARLRQILESCDPRAIIIESASEWKEKFKEEPASCPVIEFDDVSSGSAAIRKPVNSPHDLAYILYTSGSTGIPKGVMVTHYNACAFVEWGIRHFNVTHTDRMSNHSDPTFDLSVFDMFVAFGSGACLYPVQEPLDRILPTGFIKKNKLTIWFSVPSVLASLYTARKLDETALKSLRLMIFCGEPLPPNPVRALMEACPHLHVENLYGPTEATVACSAYHVKTPPKENARSVPIGWETATTQIFVLKDDNTVAGTGEKGEIYISGSQVSPGYWRNETATRAAFVPDPRFPDIHAPSYRTGDLGIVTEEGPEYIGRVDNQIKLHGWRIELGEIEKALNSFDEVAEAACVLDQEVPDISAHRLVGVIRPISDVAPDDILKKLGDQLPKYMIPSLILSIHDFPRTLNGKIDRKKILPELKRRGALK